MVLDASEDEGAGAGVESPAVTAAASLDGAVVDETLLDAGDTASADARGADGAAGEGEPQGGGEATTSPTASAKVKAKGKAKGKSKPKAKGKPKAKAAATPAVVDGGDGDEGSELGSIAESVGKAKAKSKAKGKAAGKGRAKAKATANATAAAATHEGAADVSATDVGEGDRAARGVSKAKPKSKAKGKAKAKAAATPNVEEEEAEDEASAEHTADVDNAGEDGEGGDVAMASALSVFANTGASSEVAERFDSVVCGDCKRHSHFSKCRVISKQKSMWRCASCGVKAVQLRRVFGSWPTEQFSMLSEECHTDFVAQYPRRLM